MTEERGKEDEALVEDLLAAYAENRDKVELFQDQLLSAILRSSQLEALVHSTKSRIKDPEHLRRKLRRKMATCDETGETFAVTPDTLLTSITDLAGIRLLHLYTRQISEIDPALQEVFNEQKYELLEGPFARTWDDESSEFFRGIGMATQESPTMYTSVHYVIGSASRTRVTCEIQVRTLAEELWGEVDHTVNYPTPSASLAIQEQLKVLARVTSGATRLVDAIFAVEKAEAQ
jgi:putative GTP pyrophosphokinase